MAAALDVDETQFGKRYVRQVGDRYSLIELPGGDCVFFDPGVRTCRLYRYRPRQCRTWPFWPSNLHSAETFNEVARSCPGAGRGRLHTPEEIDRQRDVVRV